jgi:alkanesulfonate monooxygenase SsuD/methylene tetrahydromethanopterin reductase-like flavin-dependent oxidoreductase (luciferase family)
MQFGIFSNGDRGRPIAADAFDEDLYEIQLVDELGFAEAWISEHQGRANILRPDSLGAVEPFIAKVGALTQNIRLGPAVRPLPIFQPIQVAIEAAMVDQLTRGRYMFGFGTGGPADDGINQRGLGQDTPAERRARMLESLELIRRCWTENEPFEFRGRYWQGKDIIISPKPYQKPHPPLAIASAQSLETIEWAAREGFIPLLSQYDDPAWVRTKADAFDAAAAAAGQPFTRKSFRVCRFAYVSDSVHAAKEELREDMTAMVRRHQQMFPHHFTHHLPPSGRVEDVTYDWLVDSGAYYVGDPDTVYQYLRTFYDETGGFGTLLLLMGKDWGTREQRDRSLRLFAEHVAPRLRDLDPDADRAHERTRMSLTAGGG